MASKKGAGVEADVASCREKKSDGAAASPSVAGAADIGRRVEDYLTSVEQELLSNGNPRLTVERSRLLELLGSYRRLCDVYKDRNASKSDQPRKLEETPEIYSVLYPELYRDKREEEKDRLRRSLVKGRLGRNAVASASCRSITRTNVEDTRQKEKDRFVRLVSSAPSAFLQPPQKKPPDRKHLAAATVRVHQRREDTREKEKDRLAKILSSDLDSNPAFRRKTGASSAPSVKKPLNVPTAARPKTRTDKRDLVKTRAEPTCPLDRADKGGGTGKRDGTKRGGSVGFCQLERRNRLLNLTNKEYQEQLDALEGRGVSKKDKAVLARESSIVDLTKEQVMSRRLGSRLSVSVATQTDDRVVTSPPVSAASPPLSKTQMDSPQSEQAKLFPVQKEAFITSPRAKLIKDLHGVSPCLPGASPLLTLPDQGVCEEKKKRCAYAEALKAQIDEKRKLEEEKRRKELEEDEHIERRAREQQHRLKQEWEREQSLRHDWLMQKEAQEETVRQRMVELELEAKELKRRERQRRGVERPPSPASATTPRQRLSPREVEQLLPQAMRDSMMSSLIMDKPRPKTLQLENNNNTLLANQNTEVTAGDKEMAAAEEGNKEINDTPGSGGEDRPPSPVLPAVQTDSIMRRSVYSSPRLELVQGDKEKEELLRGDRILTQLGVFRRELELEQERLEQRLYEQGSS